MKILQKVLPMLWCAAQASFAATEFGDEVPREIVELFIGLEPGAPVTLYSDILDDFPPLVLPGDFDVLASAELGIMQRVLLRTELDANAASTALVDALVAAGWTLMPVPGPVNGFVPADAPIRNASLCSDEHGRMVVNISDNAGVRYANLGRTLTAAFGGLRRSCAEEAETFVQNTAMRASRNPAEEIRQYMPTLAMPAPEPGIAQGGTSFGPRSSGSMNDLEVATHLVSTMDGAALFDYFAAQVDAQGWARDTQTTGAATAFGSWTKTVDGKDLVGMLSIVNTAADTWDLQFRLVRTGGATGTSVRAAFP